jgi:hypothetical protein
MIVLGFKSLEELYPSPPLGVDSADTSQLSKEKNLHGQFQYFQITQPCRSNSTPLYQYSVEADKAHALFTVVLFVSPHSPRQLAHREERLRER